MTVFFPGKTTMVTFATVLAILLLKKVAGAELESCYFDFEQDNELTNFDEKCNGINGVWNIVNRRPEPPPSGYVPGERVLQVVKERNGCLRTVKKITLDENPAMTLALYWKATSTSSYADLRITLECTPVVPLTWMVSPKSKNGWMLLDYTFKMKASECAVKLEIFRNNEDLDIDRIEIKGATSSCYVTSKPESTSTIEPTTTTTPTTKEPTTTTTDPTTTITATTATTADPTTTKEPTTTTIEPTTTTGEPTTTTTTTEVTTTNTEPTTTTTEITTEPITTTAQSTTSESTPTSSNDNNDTSQETSPATTSEATTMVPTIPTTQTSSGTSPSSPTGDSGVSGFSILFIVTIIAALGGVIIIALVTCCIVKAVGIKMRRSRTMLNDQVKTFMPRKINLA